MLIYTYIHTYIHSYIYTYIYIFYIRFPNKNNNVAVGHESFARLAVPSSLTSSSGMYNIYVCNYLSMYALYM